MFKLGLSLVAVFGLYAGAQSLGPKPLNLSVVLSESAEQGVPNRALRQQAFENVKLPMSAGSMDELDLDRFYMRELRDFRMHTPAVDLPPSPTKNGKSLLFFDLNFAPSEIRAAAVAAAARGEDLYVYPERTPAQQDQIEKEYRLSVSLSEKFGQCQKAGTKDCSDLGRQLDQSRNRLNVLTEQIKRVGGADLVGIFSELKKKNVRVSAVVFSGHSGGSMLQIGGLFGALGPADFANAVQQFPEMFAELRSVLLWGCYTGTLHNLTRNWQERFPNVEGFFGYRNRAPLGIRESSGTLLKNYLATEDKFLSASSISATHRVFKSIPNVAGLDATAVKGEAYYAYDQAGLIADFLKVCQQFDVGLLNQFNCYNNAEKGCENPPADHQGPMRTLYSFLQVNRHCKESIQEKHGHVPTVDTLIRLIYSDQVKKNFKTHHEKYFATFENEATIVGYSPEVSIRKLVTQTRAEDLQMLKTAYKDAGRVGMRDHSILDRSDWRSVLTIEGTLQGIQLLLSRFTFAEGHCVPFSWIEPNSKEKDFCGVSELLARPVNDDIERRLVEQYFSKSVERWVADNDPFFSGWYQVTSLTELKEKRKAHITGMIEWLEAVEDRSPIDERRLRLYRDLVKQGDELPMPEFKALLLSEIDGLIAHLGKLSEQASRTPKGEAAVQSVNSMRRQLSDGRKFFESLN